MLQQVVYVSSATKEFDKRALEALLAKARRNNGRSGVTGVLLYHDLSFLQILEGPSEEVHRTLARIRRDPRHTGLIVVQDQAIFERDFRDWSMAHAQGDVAGFDRARDTRKLDRDFIASLVAQLSQPASKTFVRQFGAQAYR